MSEPRGRGAAWTEKRGTSAAGRRRFEAARRAGDSVSERLHLATRGQPYGVPAHVDCAIIIVSYNSGRYLSRLLDALPAAAGGLRTRCLVVDNNSHDETMSIVGSRNDVVAVDAGRNLGYSGGINLGRTLAGSCSSVLILNPDLVLAPGAISELYKALDQTGIGMAVPMLLNDDGSIFMSMRREPTLRRALGEALFGHRWPGRPKWLNDTIRDRVAYHYPRDVEWASGAAMLISAECNDAVGAWDDGRFFLYSEETDFAARVRRSGYRIRYVPGAQAVHEIGGSGWSPALGALMAVNRVRYYEKYHHRPATSLFRTIVTLHYLVRSADPRQRAALKALIQRSRWPSLPGAEGIDR